MRVLVCHNFYQQPGGEDEVFRSEISLLRSGGHDVATLEVRNDDVDRLSKLTLARKTLWNDDSRQRVAGAARDHRAEIVHFHNTFPLLSPAAYSGAHDAGAAVVQTLHNYRFLCPAATFLRDGKVCQDCLNKSFPFAAVKHKCYRGSTAASAVTATMLAYHQKRGTYRHDVDAYITLSEFARAKFIEGGLPEERLFDKPNFVDPDPGLGTGSGGYAMFVGRLSEEKGIRTLLDTWSTSSIPLKIAGDGPLRSLVEDAVKASPAIEYLGRQPGPEILRLVGDAACLIFPSVWFEGMPRTIVESLAKGTPVIASDIGTMREMISEAGGGVRVPPGDATALAETVRKFFDDASAYGQRRQLARSQFERLYTAAQNLPRLLDIYARAIEMFSRRSS